MAVIEKVVEPEVETQGTSGGDSGSGEVEWFERSNHPLLIVVIEETLFGFVRRIDLKTCRIVSKNWNLLTLPQMRTTFKVRICGRYSVWHHESEANGNTRRIDDFVRLFRANASGIPFAKFQLGPFCMTDDVGKEFLQICRNTATEIDLDLNEGESEEYMIEDLSELLRATPYIQRLDLPYRLFTHSGTAVKLFGNSVPTLDYLQNINFRRDRLKNVLRICPNFIEELMTAAPNVSHIAVQDSDHQDGIGIGAVLNLIEKLRMESSIQSLDLGLARVQIEQLLRMGGKVNGLKLKSLRISNTSFNVDEIGPVQIQLANCFKATLQHFSMKEGVNNNLTEFPSMPYLKSLTSSAPPDLEPVSVNLSTRFPVLKTITFYQHSSSRIPPRFFSKFDSCTTVKAFNVFIDNMPVHTFHDILRVFPNLSKLM